MMREWHSLDSYFMLPDLKHSWTMHHKQIHHATESFSDWNVNHPPSHPLSLHAQQFHWGLTSWFLHLASGVTLFQDYYNNTKKVLKTITYSESNTELARHLPNPGKKVRQIDNGKQSEILLHRKKLNHIEKEKEKNNTHLILVNVERWEYSLIARKQRKQRFFGNIDECVCVSGREVYFF